MENVQRTYTVGPQGARRRPEQDADESELPARMRAVAQQQYGEPQVLRVIDAERPTPRDRQVLIRVAAASVNPLDWHMTTGTPYVLRLVAGLRRPKQAVRGVDVAGTVVGVGSGVEGLSCGDRVFGAAIGSFAEFAVAPSDKLAVLPDGVGFADAAAMPIAGITALEALRDHARGASGDRVLVNGAAGGVGTAAVQLAVAMGAQVTGVCSGRNVEMVRELGAHRVVDYETDDWVHDGAYDVIIDNVGNRPLSDCVRSLVGGGRYVMVSGPKDNRWLDPFRRLVAGKLRFARSGRSFHQFTAGESRADLEELARYLESGRLRSVIERRIALHDVPEAIGYIGTGHARAKVVVDVGP